jgi:hypothetical protein
MENPSDSVIKFGASVMIMVSCTSLTSIVDARYHCKHRLLDLLLSHPLIMRYTSIMFYFAACHIQCQRKVFSHHRNRSREPDSEGTSHYQPNHTEEASWLP